MGQNLEDIRFDGELFLEDVLEKLHKKMDELKEDLTAGEQEIRQMHDYYWEWMSMVTKIMIISRHFCIR